MFSNSTYKHALKGNCMSVWVNSICIVGDNCFKILELYQFEELYLLGTL